MKCLICSCDAESLFSEKVLYQYDVDYFQCMNCGLVFTEKPYWLEEAYNSPIAAMDTGMMTRNLSFAMKTNSIINRFFDPLGRFLDYAGGYGIFVRLMRDKGLNFYWKDKYAENLIATGFEYSGESVIELLTIFEAFEHFVNPMEEVKKLISYSESILFSTFIYDLQLKAKGRDWWYYGFESGQHITFYSRMTLEYIARKLDLKYYYIEDSLHLFSKKQLSERELHKTATDKRIHMRDWINGSKNTKIWTDMAVVKIKGANDKIVIYGTGNIGQRIYNAFSQNKIDIVAVADSDPQKWGKQFNDFDIISPEKIKDTEYTRIFVASSKYAEIIQKLMMMGYDEEQIMYLDVL